MSNYIHPITMEAALAVASNLLPDDRREEEEGHYISRTWYDRGCRCDGCKKAKSLTRRKHE